MAVRTHYNVLGVAADADAASIRSAYRRLARDHHPDRIQGSAAPQGGRSMPAINQAYHVLSDPGRRAIYDRSLTKGSSSAAGTAATSGTPDRATSGAAHGVDEERWDLGAHQGHRPARIPWRSLSVFASAAIIAIVVLAQFADEGEVRGPDGILRIGDCVEIEPNGDAREVLCTGTDDDLVIRAFNPLFDSDCPGLTEPHRDRQGMGVACVAVPD